SADARLLTCQAGIAVAGAHGAGREQGYRVPRRGARGEPRGRAPAAAPRALQGCAGRGVAEKETLHTRGVSGSLPHETACDPGLRAGEQPSAGEPVGASGGAAGAHPHGHARLQAPGVGAPGGDS
ncbi:unnamed protein product, partial [Effrenium voratum]